jgi:hypothetical protein
VFGFVSRSKLLALKIIPLAFQTPVRHIARHVAAHVARTTPQFMGMVVLDTLGDSVVDKNLKIRRRKSADLGGVVDAQVDPLRS